MRNTAARGANVFRRVAGGQSQQMNKRLQPSADSATSNKTRLVMESQEQKKKGSKYILDHPKYEKNIDFPGRVNCETDLKKVSSCRHTQKEQLPCSIKFSGCFA